MSKPGTKKAMWSSAWGTPSIDNKQAGGCTPDVGIAHMGSGAKSRKSVFYEKTFSKSRAQQQKLTKPT